MHSDNHIITTIIFRLLEKLAMASKIEWPSIRAVNWNKKTVVQQN